MPLTNTDIDLAVPPTGIPNRLLTNAVLKGLLTTANMGKTLRSIATRCGLTNSFNTSNKQTMSRSRHVMRAACDTVQLLYGNWSPSINTGEDGTGQSTVYTASIEYPAGTFTQVLFGGQTSATVANLGEVISDPLAISIPLNAEFWVRTWTNNTAGILYIGKSESAEFGEAMEFGVTTPDKTMSGSVTRNGAGIVTPYAILGMSATPSAFLFGDSRVFGQDDSYANAYTNDVGILARAIGGTMAYMTCAIPGDRASIIAGSMARRASLAKRFHTSVVLVLGINDLNNDGKTGAQVWASIRTIMGLLRPLPVFLGTVDPTSTSTNSFATVAGQTTAASNAERVALNNLIRGSVASAGVFEIADIVESARDSGIWKAPGWTVDGLHEQQLACAAIANSRAIDVGRLA